MNKLADFHKRLARWYRANGRHDLPWRHTDDAYAIYISEIMLQQTQVATVLDRFYFPFLKRFPTLASLAAATREDVLSMWQGLGYYSRAANLHEAAKRCGGAMPRTVEGLMALPGIGRNTAHAIAAFAYHEPVAVMEANVKRVLSRIFALKQPAADELWEKAGGLLNRRQPFDFNQAMMDLGSMVCTRRAPRCDICPANAICEGKTAPESYPAPKAKKTVPVREKRIVLLQDGKGRIFAEARRGRFLTGLYRFIETERDAAHVSLGKSRYDLAKASRLGAIRQQYSHFTLEADVLLLPAKASGRSWYARKELERLPLSMAERKILALLEAS